MQHIKLLSAAIVLFFVFGSTAIAQNPVTLDCESGNRAKDQASCWRFPNSVFSAGSALDGKFSDRTQSLSQLSNPGGAVSPWIKMSGTGNISWLMALDGWAGVNSRKFVLFIEDINKIGTLDTLYTFDFTQKNATDVQKPSVAIKVSGVYRLYFYFYGDKGGSKGILDDISIDGDYYSSPSNNCGSLVKSKDTDGDGVPDDQDAFPNDVTRAYSVPCPAGGPGSLFYEDLWPNMGDFDLNDLVVDYQFIFTTNAANKVVDMTCNFTTRAIGANNHNGFAMQFDDLDPSYIESVKGGNFSGSKWVDLAANGTENGQKFANIIVFDDAFNVYPPQGSGILNTILTKPYIAPPTTTVVVTFSKAPGKEITIADLAMNPYLVLSQVRGNEMHLVDNFPTSKADTKMFGTGDDNTNPAKGIYYRTKTNLPFGIYVEQSIPYMQEYIDFVKGYPNIAKWAESNGQSNNDWYLDDPGNRNKDVLYLR